MKKRNAGWYNRLPDDRRAEVDAWDAIAEFVSERRNAIVASAKSFQTARDRRAKEPKE